MRNRVKTEALALKTRASVQAITYAKRPSRSSIVDSTTSQRRAISLPAYLLFPASEDTDRLAQIHATPLIFSRASSIACGLSGTDPKTCALSSMVYWPFSEKTSRVLRGCPVSRQSEGHPPLSSDGSVRHRPITPSSRRSFPGRTSRRFRCDPIRFFRVSPLISLPPMVACRLTISNKIIC